MYDATKHTWKKQPNISPTVKKVQFSKIVNKLGYVADIVIIVYDSKQIYDDIQNNRDASHSIGALILDASGAAIGYINPATGLVITFAQCIAATDQHKLDMYFRYSKLAQERVEAYKDDPNPLLFIYDTKYIRYKKLRDEYYEKSSLYKPRPFDPNYTPELRQAP